jgi:hypothetical protein
VPKKARSGQNYTLSGEIKTNTSPDGPKNQSRKKLNRVHRDFSAAC